MAIKTILAGVDASPEGEWAATVGWRLSERSGGTCTYVHAAFDLTSIATLPPTVDYDEYVQRLAKAAGEGVREQLRGTIPEEALGAIDIRVGRPGFVLTSAADELDVDLIVLGGRRRSAASRWLEGSTLKHLVRVGRWPVLAAIPPHLEFRRVLVPLDSSEMMGPTFQHARLFADLTGAELRVIHSVEPLPYDYSGFIHAPEEYVDWATTEFLDRFRELPDSEGIEPEVLRGAASRIINREARRWNADLLVVGSHGKGLVDRILLGSTTSKLINQFPASLLVIPAPHPVAAEQNPEANARAEVTV